LPAGIDDEHVDLVFLVGAVDRLRFGALRAVGRAMTDEDPERGLGTTGGSRCRKHDDHRYGQRANRR
jgi:hypothetical protein